MAKNFTFYDGFVLLLIGLYMTNTGPHLTVFHLFIPWLIEWLSKIFSALNKMFGWYDRLKFKLWQWTMHKKIKNASAQAKKTMQEWLEAQRPKFPYDKTK